MIVRAIARGPFALERTSARIAGVALVVALTLATAVGGLVTWPVLGLAPLARTGRRRAALAIGSVATYLAVVAFVVPALAAPLGRVALPCAPDGALAPRSMLFCLANRSYVVPALRDEALAIAADVRAHDPEAHVLYLDGAFPIPGLPILPHLSHGDARRLDVALPMQSGTGSPIGYFGYAPLEPGERAACAPSDGDRRWDLDWLQPLFGPPRLDVPAASRLVRAAVARDGIRRVLLEPHVSARLGVRSGKVQFQGCHAARHDDHVHLEVAD